LESIRQVLELDGEARRVAGQIVKQKGRSAPPVRAIP
jgi:hypothetical protein